VIPKLNPIRATGRSFGDLRRDIEKIVASSFVSTTVIASIGQIHQVSVLVAGEVRSPGGRFLSGLASPLDAILLAGGIRKTGSLRNVRIVRGGTSRSIDLYSVIASGNATRLGVLRDGDLVYVPPIGATVAAGGGVTLPGIYELLPGTKTISVSALMRLAGGAAIGGSYRLSKVALARDGSRHLVPVAADATVSSGEALLIDATQNVTLDQVFLSGAVMLKGRRPFSVTGTVSELIRSVNDLEPEAYGLFALIIRHDPASTGLMLVPYSIAAALTGRTRTSLRGRDMVFVFTRDEARALATVAARSVDRAHGLRDPQNRTPSSMTPDVSSRATSASAPLSGAEAAADQNVIPQGAVVSAPVGSNGSSGGDALPLAGDMRSGESDEFSRELTQLGPQGLNLPQPGTPTDDAIIDRLSTEMRVSKQALVRVAADNLVLVIDQVLAPGPYLAAPYTSLDDVLKVAGGPLRQADLSSIEVTSTAVDQIRGMSHTTRSNYAITENLTAVALSPRDVVRVRKAYSSRERGTVTLAGEIHYPGTYDVTRGERLSALLGRAGGLTDVAYPYGAIFLRKAAAIGEREGNQRSAAELQKQIAMYLASNSQSGPASSSVEYLTRLVKEVREAPVLGRITVTADPSVLAAHPDLDILLQAGDTLYVPKRPSSVSVSGEVLHPGSLQFRASYDFDDYLASAGGITRSADARHAFIVFPNGTASLASSDWLSSGRQGQLPPGSVIVVPRDLRPFNWGTFLKDATQIVSQLAVTAASLSVIRNN